MFFFLQGLIHFFILCMQFKIVLQPLYPLLEKHRGLPNPPILNRTDELKLAKVVDRPTRIAHIRIIATLTKALSFGQWSNQSNSSHGKCKILAFFLHHTFNIKK